jgi:hypothetical protein
MPTPTPCPTHAAPAITEPAYANAAYRARAKAIHRDRHRASQLPAHKSHDRVALLRTDRCDPLASPTTILGGGTFALISVPPPLAGGVGGHP